MLFDIFSKFHIWHSTVWYSTIWYSTENAAPMRTLHAKQNFIVTESLCGPKLLSFAENAGSRWFYWHFKSCGRHQKERKVFIYTLLFEGPCARYYKTFVSSSSDKIYWFFNPSAPSYWLTLTFVWLYFEFLQQQWHFLHKLPSNIMAGFDLTTHKLQSPLSVMIPLYILVCLKLQVHFVEEYIFGKS
jgi:hypothetical protein